MIGNLTRQSSLTMGSIFYTNTQCLVRVPEYVVREAHHVCEELAQIHGCNRSGRCGRRIRHGVITDLN
jgi:hypothetical protein